MTADKVAPGPEKAPARKATAKPVPPAEPTQEAPALRRGGYVNRDDGAGWVLEEE